MLQADSDTRISMTARRVALALCAWAALSATSAQADSSTARLKRELSQILDAPELSKALTGVHVRRLSDNAVLFEQNSGRLFNPASNMKLLTTAAALTYLGPNYHFRTRVYYDGELKGGELKGDLYIVGGGDPLLTTENMFGLVNQLAMHGLRSVRGDLYVDASFFDGVGEGPGWEQEHADHAYAAPVGALSVNFNTFELRVLPGGRVGAPLRYEVWPPTSSVMVEMKARTRGAYTRSFIRTGTSREEDNRVQVTVRGAMAKNLTSGRVIRRRIHDPARYAGEAFKSLLRLRGIRVRGKLRQGKLPRRKATLLVTHYSKPLAEVVSTLNKYSNNFMAEMILKTVAAEVEGAPGTWKKGTKVLSSLLVELGVPANSFVLGNGSGLNDVNRVTPEQITFLLAKMYQRFELRPEFVASLAVAGESGTINGRFENTAANSRLRAKTGSLSGVSALSGYVVTRDNEVLAFSVMMNDYPGRARSMWRVQDRIGVALARFGDPTAVATAPGHSR